MEKNILLTIEYDGTMFSGWQRQPNMRTVQGELEKALSLVCGTDIEVNGTSRTDAGVHALGQRATFAGDIGIPTERLAIAVNNLLAGMQSNKSKGSDIRIVEAEEVPMNFHARFNSNGKKYRYVIDNNREVSVFGRNFSYHVKQPLNVAAMIQGGKHIVGCQDFACFQAAGGTPREITVRTVNKLLISRKGNIVEIEISGDGFLYNMVRIITGTLVDVGLGKIEPDFVKMIIASRNRQNAGHTAPPQGLFLAEIYYDELKERQ